VQFNTLKAHGAVVNEPDLETAEKRFVRVVLDSPPHPRHTPRRSQTNLLEQPVFCTDAT
jgi:hypothetical protein